MCGTPSVTQQTNAKSNEFVLRKSCGRTWMSPENSENYRPIREYLGLMSGRFRKVSPQVRIVHKMQLSTDSTPKTANAPGFTSPAHLIARNLIRVTMVEAEGLEPSSKDGITKASTSVSYNLISDFSLLQAGSISPSP